MLDYRTVEVVESAPKSRHFVGRTNQRKSQHLEQFRETVQAVFVGQTPTSERSWRVIHLKGEVETLEESAFLKRFQPTGRNASAYLSLVSGQAERA